MSEPRHTERLNTALDRKAIPTEKPLGWREALAGRVWARRLGSDEPEGRRGRAVELLELRDNLDLLEEELRIRKIVLLLTPVISTVLAAPLLIVLFINEVPFFLAYPSIFLILLGAILRAIGVERRRLGEERGEIQNRIRLIEGPPSDSKVTAARAGRGFSRLSAL